MRDVDDAQLPAGCDRAVSHSTLNYKGALAITGKGPVVRKFDGAGHRPGRGGGAQCASRISAGRCRAAMAGVGEVHWGGLAQAGPS